MRATVQRFADKDARRVAAEVEARAKRLAPVDTGRLRQSIYTRRKLTIRGPGYEVRTDVAYAPYVEGGTRPHVIRARNAKALRFRVGNRVVYANAVHHPGTKAQPFLSRAVREVAIANGYNVRVTG